MTKLAQVVVLFEQNASNIAAMLRDAAASVETEEAEGFAKTRAMVAVQISEGGAVQVYGWGHTDSLDSIAVLTLGAAQLTNRMLQGEDD